MNPHSSTAVLAPTAQHSSSILHQCVKTSCRMLPCVPPFVLRHAHYVGQRGSRVEFPLYRFLARLLQIWSRQESNVIHANSLFGLRFCNFRSFCSGFLEDSRNKSSKLPSLGWSTGGMPSRVFQTARGLLDSRKRRNVTAKMCMHKLVS